MLVRRSCGTVKYTLSVDYILQEAVRCSKRILIYASEWWMVEQRSFFNSRNDPEVVSQAHLAELDLGYVEKSLITSMEHVLTDADMNHLTIYWTRENSCHCVVASVSVCVCFCHG